MPNLPASTFFRTSWRRRSLAAIVGAASLAAPTAGTAAAVPAGAGSPSVMCWKEYDFTRTGNTLIASAFKECTHLDAPQPLAVGVEMWYSDPDWAGWITIASGSGVARTDPGYCGVSWPTTYRHSITHQQISCP
jgi:hypothetical protein